MLHSFHVSVHARGAQIASAAMPAQLAQGEFACLDVPQAELALSLPRSFEEAVAELEKLPRMFCEPDGSFVWTSSAAEVSWQIDGQLFDRQGRLLLVDLKGSCPNEQFDELLAAFGWPQCQVMFQLVQEAVFLDEAEFRRWASVASR